MLRYHITLLPIMSDIVKMNKTNLRHIISVFPMFLFLYSCVYITVCVTVCLAAIWLIINNISNIWYSKLWHWSTICVCVDGRSMVCENNGPEKNKKEERYNIRPATIVGRFDKDQFWLQSQMWRPQMNVSVLGDACRYNGSHLCASDRS